MLADGLEGLEVSEVELLNESVEQAHPRRQMARSLAKAPEGEVKPA